MQSILEVFRRINTDVIPVNLLRLGKVSNKCPPIRGLRYQIDMTFTIFVEN